MPWSHLLPDYDTDGFDAALVPAAVNEWRESGPEHAEPAVG
jgi:hypothetical protein